eukprot:CAMPEP_0168623476 /NCGR_PEP_ID=MMETSP0449_2-20121227/8849_1 /TAXON_ID=1082188 /ORGANISM="Strombidium rassoulzadegani, Strain ras09" /LENGTH=54 /DNA_ID=CAMNT_0008664867 /DNA_START=309 /DNA_END=473 /DNA_ORIENTATION=+
MGAGSIQSHLVRDPLAKSRLGPLFPGARTLLLTSHSGPKPDWHQARRYASKPDG